jgi:zinc protease
VILSFILSALVVQVANASIVPSTFKLPEPEVEKLSNGMTIAWFVDDKLPVVDFGLLVQTGTRNDPMGKSGTAELTARMLERGAHGISASEFANRVESLGASGFATADEEGISMGVHGLSQDSDILLETLGWMAREPNFLPTEFRREKDRLAEGWRHLTDSAESVSGYVFGKAILGNTPYARGSLENLKNLSKVKLRDVQEFHRLNFVPSNSILLVVGRVDREQVKTRINSLFGNWKGALPKKKSFSVKNLKFQTKKGEVLVVDMPGLPQAQIRLGFRVPGIRSPKRYAFSVGNALLGEYFNSRLNLIVRDRLGLAYGIHSSPTYFKDFAFFAISSATATRNTGRLIEETIHQLRLMKAADILKEEVDTAKDYLIGGFPLGVSTLSAIANRWMTGYSLQLGPEYLNEFMPKIASVSRENVVQAIDEAFQLDQLVVVVAGDAKAIEKSLKEKGFKRIRRIPAKTLL